MNVNHEENQSLTYNEFIDIIGYQKLREIKTEVDYGNDNHPNEGFQLLMKIFQKFKEHGNEGHDEIVHKDYYELNN